MANKSKRTGKMQPENTLTVVRNSDETGAQAMARTVLEPHMRHAISASSFAGGALGKDFEGPGLMDYVDHLQSATAKAEAGDMALVSRMLTAQAVTLDSMFTELARRSAVNMGEYIEAAERYGRLALKAQANSRATLEALAKLHQPREQTVRHVQVNDGGQAVIADQFHNNTGGAGNGKSVKQSHATTKSGECAPLSCQNAKGNEVPIPSREGAQAMPNARRDEPRSAER